MALPVAKQFVTTVEDMVEDGTFVPAGTVFRVLMQEDGVTMAESSALGIVVLLEDDAWE